MNHLLYLIITIPTMSLYEVGPRAPWASGPSLATRHMTLSPFWTFSLDPDPSGSNLGPKVEIRLRWLECPKQTPPNHLLLGRGHCCSELPCTRLSGSAFGDIAARWASGGGNQFLSDYIFPPENPLKDDGIGPPFALARGSNHNTSTHLRL